MYIKISQSEYHFTRILQLVFACQFVIEFVLLFKGPPCCCPYADITRFTCSPNANTTTITLPLFLRISTTFSHSSSFTKISTPPILDLFLDHHNLYLRPKSPRNRVPLFFHLTSFKLHTSTFFFLNSSHTSTPLPQRLPSFQLLSLIGECR